eukprot:CAMPEP_0183356792 /NCGR_PEP_ID=MMETSP0164_2-20130417/45195_1 /TAXON_ID=221442 /ORGANISM="Coccolithus pelagicus ssp braarudi, Strain PLY182g" /LENGTH=109 /DNA_ID=CAMNT_0025530289 /DNA_START=575 /DNA_END=904 /DNA_ORIENTATION=+
MDHSEVASKLLQSVAKKRQVLWAHSGVILKYQRHRQRSCHHIPKRHIQLDTLRRVWCVLRFAQIRPTFHTFGWRAKQALSNTVAELFSIVRSHNARIDLELSMLLALDR